MKTRLLTTTGVTLLALSLVGCNPSEEPVSPSPSVSASESTPTPSDAPEPTPTTAPSTIIVDVSQVPITFEATGSYTPEDVTAAVAISVAFTQQAVTNPAWYSGSWKQNDWPTNVASYLPFLTETMQNTLSGYNWEDATQRGTIASFFPVFEPTDVLTVSEECGTTWEECVRENIVFSQIAVAEEDGRIKVSYVVTTNRALFQGETPAQSKLEYTVTHWLTKTPEGAWLIDATNNSTVFGQVTKAAV